jgi:phage tail protein, P2 protein I family
MPDPVSLLPPNRTAWEHAISLASAARRPLPAHIIRNAVDPWTAPEHLLPWLAWAWSIDLWSDDWTVERKRRVIARAVRLHRLKGTERGMAEHIDLVDGELVQVVTPPQRFFALPGPTKEQMDAWLLSMPQIRVYLARDTGSAAGLSFIGGFVGHSFAKIDAGRALLGRAARLWDRGEERRLLLADVTTERERRNALVTERVSLPGNAGRFGAFDGRFAGHCFAGVVVAAANVVTFRLQTTYEHSVSSLSLTSVRPGLEPIDVRYERIFEKGHDDRSAFARRFVGHCFARPDQAAWLVYDRIVLHDPERAAPWVRAWSFANVSHIGIPAFTAKAVIDAKIKRPERGLVANHSYASHEFARPEDESRREAVKLAVRVSKSARDRILITHKLTRPVTFADSIALDGSVSFGARVKFRL